MSAQLDKGLLFGNAATGEIINVPEGTETIEVDGAVFAWGNRDRSRNGGYRVPRTFPTRGEYPNYIGAEGFWHPDNEAAKAATRKER